MSKTWLGTAYVVIAAVLWSTGGLAIKEVQADPLVIVSLRAAIAGVAFLPFLRFSQIKPNKILYIYIGSYAWLVTSFVTATKFTSAANAIALQNTAPLFIFLYTIVIMKERPGWHYAIPMGFIATGVMAMLSEPSEGVTFFGNIIGLSSGVAFACMTLTLHRLDSISGMALVSLGNLSTAIIIFIIMPNKGNLLALDFRGLMLLLYLGVVQIGIAYVFYAKGLKLISPLKAGVLALTEAVLNPIWVFFFWGESPSVQGIIGMIFILMAVLIDNFFKIRDKKSEVCEFNLENGGNNYGA